MKEKTVINVVSEEKRAPRTLKPRHIGEFAHGMTVQHAPDSLAPFYKALVKENYGYQRQSRRKSVLLKAFIFSRHRGHLTSDGKWIEH